MTSFWQAAGVWSLGAALAWAGETEGAFAWAAPEIPKGGFSHRLGMLASERDEFASHLGSRAGNVVAAAEASPASLEEAHKLLAVALHLSPRNRRSLVVNFQLGKGILPETVQPAYSPPVLARLLLTRGQLLAKEGGGENAALARMFFQLAADMDPKNEEAVFMAELQRRDHGAADGSRPDASCEAPVVSGGIAGQTP